MSWETIEPKQELESRISANGGWVNSHAHIDRSYIINKDNWVQTGDELTTKWSHTDKFKSEATVEDILGKMSQVVENQLEQGVQSLGSFIDCDSVVEDKSIRAAEKLKERYGGEIDLVFMNQPIKGLLDQTERSWFEYASDFVDVIGGLPERDDTQPGGKDEHFNRIFSIADELDKPLHIHIDQLNNPSQRDTEIAIEKTKDFGYAGRVTLIHCISLAAQHEGYRLGIYKELAEQEIGVITCPSSWIDHRRNEVMAPSHNAITPVDEMLKNGVTVSMGTDNIADIYKPFSDGNMWTEMRFLLEATHTYDISALAEIATTNGLEALGLLNRDVQQDRLAA